MKLLKKLTETPGVPGREEKVRTLILKETKGLFDETGVDPMGNLICRKRPGKKKRGQAQKVLIACHIDEIGFYVSHIDENGMLRLQNVGGFDTRNLHARRVMVHGKKDLVGVLNPAARPVHMATEEERKKIYKVGEFFVDMFLDKEEVEKQVRVGDPVTLIQPLEDIGNVYNGKCLDNRIATWILINALKKVGNRSAYDIYYAATVQEEVGLRGAGPTAFGVDPDIGLVVDTTLCCDLPGVEPREHVTTLGGGVALKIMDAGAISHRGLLDEFITLADKKKIPYQLEVMPMGRTDAAPVQQAAAGRKTMTLSIPTRYIHTVTESVHKQDIKAAVDLLAAWLVA